ncbi:hypothetical protein [Marinicellulosiphila megalodicopiae]|uniref:hypothetical protein n=1 Tax=Marinicellulosiphila megalodicopiae TaxID=2724896 RepID=UPI003BB036E2
MENNKEVTEKKVKHKLCGCEKSVPESLDMSFYCAQCKANSKSFNLKSPFKIAAILAILGFTGSNFIEYAATDNRYSISAEYDLLNACINSSKKVQSKAQYQAKEKICFCALEDTMNEISYIRYMLEKEDILDKDKFDGFDNVMKKNTLECKKA